VGFWFTPADPAALRALRIMAGVLFLGWFLSFAKHVDELFGPQGWYDSKAAAEAGKFPDGAPGPGGWTVVSLAGSSSTRLAAVYWSSVAAVALCTVGVLPRLTAILTWVAIASFTSNPAIDADVNALLNILAFYLMIGCVLSGRRGQPSIGANVAVRLLQVHLAIVMVASGLHKLQFGDWWAGVAFWYPLHPPFETTVAAARAHAKDLQTYLGLLSVAAYLTLAWQIGFPLFAWRRGVWRVLLLGGATLGWLAMAWLYGLPWFGPALFIGCLSYLSPEDWHLWMGRLGRLVRRRSGSAEPAAAKSGGTASLAAVGHESW
jgi:hypothetical protein